METSGVWVGVYVCVMSIQSYGIEIQLIHFCLLFYWHIFIYSTVKQLDLKNFKILLRTDDSLL